MRYLSRKLWLLVLVLGWACSSVLAADVAKVDAKKIRTLIEAQIAAFAADDATRAFSLAAPGIRGMAGTPENFMEMVRTNYPVVYRPASVKFLTAETIGGKVFQTVQMTDAKGDLWMALYSLERQPDKSWRIDGCVVQKGEVQVI